MNGLIYSPEKLNTSAEADALIMAVDNAEAFKTPQRKGPLAGYPCETSINGSFQLQPIYKNSIKSK